MTEDYEYEQEAAYEEFREELIANALKEISYDGISCYLFYYGHAIETRIEGCLKSARDLHNEKYYAPSVLYSCAAVEVTIRYLILSPLMQGMFLHDEWADVLTRRILSGQGAKDREMLPSVLRFWKIDINEVRLASGEPLWKVLHERIWQARNKCAHQGDPSSEEVSSNAIEAATLMVQLANDVLEKAMGRKRGKDGWGYEKSQSSPFTQGG